MTGKRRIIPLLVILVLLLSVPAYADDCRIDDGGECGIAMTANVPPRIISGTDAVYKKGSASGLTFTTNDAKVKHRQVLIDGNSISSESYIVSGEPLTITLDTDYLDSLTEGTHTIGIETENGTAKASFTVRATPQPTNPTNPKTGDSNHLLLWVVLLAVSGAALTGAAIYSKRRR